MLKVSELSCGGAGVFLTLALWLHNLSKPLCFATSGYGIHPNLLLFLRPVIQIWKFYLYLEELLYSILGWKDIFFSLIHSGLCFLRMPKLLIIVVYISSGIHELPPLFSFSFLSNIFLLLFFKCGIHLCMRFNWVTKNYMLA